MPDKHKHRLFETFKQMANAVCFFLFFCEDSDKLINQLAGHQVHGDGKE